MGVVFANDGHHFFLFERGTDLEIGHPRLRALGLTLCRAGLGRQFFAALAALCPKGALNLGRPSKIFIHPSRYLI